MSRRRIRWRENAEGRLLQPILDAARGVLPGISHVELDLTNGGVRILTTVPTSGAQKHQIKSAARGAAAAADPNVCLTTVDVRQPHPLPYTLHVEPGLTIPVPLDNAARGFHEVHVDAAAVASLGNTYDLLWGLHADRNDYVATFALGGIPAMNHITDRAFNAGGPHDNNAALARRAECQNKFHAFAGPNWELPGVAAVTAEFERWLDSLPPGSSVLVFDTGAKGNGVRQAAGMVRHYIATRGRVPLASVTVLGVVDEPSSTQVREHETLVTLSGQNVVFALEYIHVLKNIHEDCEELIGYESLREQGRVRPLLSDAVIKLFDARGKPYCVVGAPQTAASALASLLKRRVAAPDPSLFSTPAEITEVHEFVAELHVMRTAFERELQELDHAHAMGLIDAATRTELRERLGKSYRGRARAYPKAVRRHDQRAATPDSPPAKPAPLHSRKPHSAAAVP